MLSPESSVTKFRVKKFPVTDGNGNNFSHHQIEQIANEPVAKVTSCLRCRKLKKKCNKAKPECSNCDKAGEECQYVPRKQRVTKRDKLKFNGDGPSTPQHDNNNNNNDDDNEENDDDLFVNTNRRDVVEQSESENDDSDA